MSERLPVLFLTDPIVLPGMVVPLELDDAAARVLEYIAARVPAGKGLLAGNTVGQDKLFLARYMPAVVDHLPPVGDQVQVQRARGVGAAARAAEPLLDGM